MRAIWIGFPKASHICYMTDIDFMQKSLGNTWHFYACLWLRVAPYECINTMSTSVRSLSIKMGTKWTKAPNFIFELLWY